MNDDGSADLRARLIDAALASLEGGEEVGLRAVARAVGVSAMAPYRHFHDKTALLVAVACRGFDQLRDVLVAVDGSGDPREALVAQGEAYIAFARAHPALFRLMFAGHGEPGPPPVDGTAYGVMVRRVQQLDPADEQAAALACWSAVHGMATLALDGSLPAAGSPHERAALKLVVGGLSKA